MQVRRDCVILHELDKMRIREFLLKWINGYFQNRNSSGFFQGCKSEHKDMTLSNVLVFLLMFVFLFPYDGFNPIQYIDSLSRDKCLN